MVKNNFKKGLVTAVMLGIFSITGFSQFADCKGKWVKVIDGFSYHSGTKKLVIAGRQFIQVWVKSGIDSGDIAGYYGVLYYTKTLLLVNCKAGCYFEKYQETVNSEDGEVLDRWVNKDVFDSPYYPASGTALFEMFRRLCSKK